MLFLPGRRAQSRAGSLAACLFLLAAGCGDDPAIPVWEPPPPPVSVPVDVRFRGVGHQLNVLSLVGATGGPILGGSGELAFWRGAGYLAWGITMNDLIAGHALLVSNDSTVRVMREWWNGRDCPTSLQQAMALNSILLGLGGDPFATGATCTLLGVGPDETDPLRYKYLTGSAQTPAEIEAALDADEEARSFVVTAITDVGDGLLSFVAESVGAVNGNFERFETAVRRVDVSALEAEATALASAGYVITASSWEGGPFYTLVGTRPPGAGAPTRYARVVQSNPGEFVGEVSSMTAEGFAPVSATAGRLTEVGDLIVYLVGER